MDAIDFAYGVTWNTVRRFFAWLCRSGLIPANPAADLDLPRKQSRPLPKSLSEEEISLLLAVPNTADPFGLRDRTMLELFYSTGIRRAEMANLDVGDYDPHSQTLTVRKGKGGKSRMLPVGERAAAWVDRFLCESRPRFDHLPGETALFLSGYGRELEDNDHDLEPDTCIADLRYYGGISHKVSIELLNAVHSQNRYPARCATKIEHDKPIGTP